MQLNKAYGLLTSKRPCGPNKAAIRGATYDLAKDGPWKEPFESLPDVAFHDIADWERRLIQERVRGLREVWGPANSPAYLSEGRPGRAHAQPPFIAAEATLNAHL